MIQTDEYGQRVFSGKQVNGYYVVVETISTKQNELKFKTMYAQKTIKSI
ncbi:MAG: hypothetical protein MRZ19_06325 [Helicobacter sp.]|nr:hypothetical protein [Helicobacter sp.]